MLTDKVVTLRLGTNQILHSAPRPISTCRLQVESKEAHQGQCQARIGGPIIMRPPDPSDLRPTILSADLP